ncbi:MAG: 2TM domain-containing protein [Saprospiraceae bacterium]|nr:2TM domain-containing protein [Candidatus Opimibacter iunctus]
MMIDPRSVDTHPDERTEAEYREAEKRLKKIKSFYKNLANWAGVSLFMLALDYFLSGGISWSKYPVFFWGISLVIDVFQVIRLQRMDKSWEDRQMRRFTGRTISRSNSDNPEDYSEELLNKKERQMDDLKEYRTAGKPWNDKDLV